MGIKTTITTSNSKKYHVLKYHVLIEESERIKKCQRLLARRKKDTANKLVHELLEHERVYYAG